MNLTANKGEWSELYVLFKILGDKKIHNGDGELNKLESFYPILKVIRDELHRHLEYGIDKDLVFITEDGKEIAQICVTDFLEQSEILFQNIKNAPKGNGSFEIPSIKGFLQNIHCEKIKAKSQDKSDIQIVLHDYHTGLNPKLGFSIKSEAGANPTLLNASKATTFMFEINSDSFSDDMMNKVNSISGNRKIQDRVNAIIQMAGKLTFSNIPNSTFENNLRMIDSYMPEIIAWLISDCYYMRDMNLKRAVERIKKSNPLNFKQNDDFDYYAYKVKNLMICSALGMLPATPWNGKYETTGGYIVVKDNGDLICFHLYDRNQLEDYLFNNTKFETPKIERYNMGTVYKIDNKYFFNLILQIRFT